MSDTAQFLARSAYATALGIEHARDLQGPGGSEEGQPIMRLDGGDPISGRPGFYHGGAISGLLETTGYAGLRHALIQRGDELPALKPINITVQFLAPAKAGLLLAQARISKLGRRSAHVEIACWQDDRDKPRATALMNVLMVPQD
ncbi:hypothetical protein HME9302_01652 [Alteripontixanthobacter maritimus]|uniref:Thioesterase domain-containing protein n=1 Tax=Alteripontixanthobacter maritimus TaxID=2161824 RepID=A0A369QA70_9SPHN|nr:PaaI family thioesterase [Alteripontixanthobacter maritimus]RDC60445.1 hypothetical protein HME9302_01652 [Alteripontixanthobacter maritimus]